MTRHTLAHALLLATLTAARAHAETYTWSGTTDLFSDPAAWTTAPPPATGDPSTMLLFPNDTTATYTATLDSPGPFTLNTLTLGTTLADPANITLAATGNASLLFDGLNPSINLPPPSDIFGFPESNFRLTAPVTSTSNLTITSNGRGHLTIAAPLSFTGPNAQLTIAAWLDYEGSAEPTGLATTRIGPNGSFTWDFTPPAIGSSTIAFGSGAVHLNDGSFGLRIPQSIPPGFTATLTSDFVVQGYSDFETFISNYSYNAPFPQGSVRLTGTIQLNGMLEVGGSFPIDLAGTVLLDESNNGQPWLFGIGGQNDQPTTISGNIIDDPDPSHRGTKPLVLSGDSNLIIAGTHNTYSVGTLVQFGSVTLLPNATLGTGPIQVSGGTLHLSSLSSIAPNQKILVDDGVLALQFDTDPTPFLNSASNGTLALDTTFTTPLNLATLGNGLMTLGSTSNGTYTPTTLGSGIDHVYRFRQLSGYDVTLTLPHGVLTDEGGIPSSAILGGITLNAANTFSGGSLITGYTYANAPGSLGTGPVTINPNDGTGQTTGVLNLSAPNTYSSAITVNANGTLAAVGPHGSLPLTATAPNLLPGSTLVLGDNLTANADRYPDTLPLPLHTSTLQLDGYGTTTETVGPISFTGTSAIIFQNPANGSHSTILSAPSLEQQGDGVLFLEFSNASLSPGSTSYATLRLNATPPVVNGIVSPSIQVRSGAFPFFGEGVGVSFLTYGDTGFALPAYTTLPIDGGTGTEVVDLPYSWIGAFFPSPQTPLQQLLLLLAGAPPANLILGTDGALSGPILPQDTSIYALRTSWNILNPAGTSTTLHILSGGLIINPGGVIEPAVDFGTAHAIVNVDNPYHGGDPAELRGIVTAANGLTKVGSGTLLLSNPSNQIAGPIHVDEGVLELASLPSSSSPLFLSNGAVLKFDNSTTLTRPVLLEDAPFTFYYFGATLAEKGLAFTINAPITGNVPLTITAQGVLTINAPVAVRQLTIASPIAVLNAPITATDIGLSYGQISGSTTVSATTPIYPTQVTLAPGPLTSQLLPLAFGTLTFITPHLDLDPSDTLEIGLNADGESDHLVIVGDLIITADTILDSNNIPFVGPTLGLFYDAPPTGRTYTLLSATSITGTFATVTGLPDGYALDYTPTAILLVPTPEPATILPLTAALFLLQRRNR